MRFSVNSLILHGILSQWAMESQGESEEIPLFFKKLSPGDFLRFHQPLAYQGIQCFTFWGRSCQEPLLTTGLRKGMKFVSGEIDAPHATGRVLLSMVCFLPPCHLPPCSSSAVDNV